MKNVMTSLVLLISVLGFSQSNDLNGLVVKKVEVVENVAISITVDSAEEIKKSLRIEDVREALEMSSPNQSVNFSITCNGKPNPNGVRSHMTYKIKGNSNDTENFLKRVEILRSSAIKFYNYKF